MTDNQYYEYGSGGEVPMSKRETGGSAFPVDGNDPGMTLRDYFAAKAMAGVIDSCEFKNSHYIAGWAYEIADAMLAARDKT